MNHAAPALLQALEASGAGTAIRQSVWLYPFANVAHVVAVLVFAGAVAAMDVRLLGGFSGSDAGNVLRNARRVSLGAFAVIAITGSMLFLAEASHVALNPVFQTKLLLIALALLNVLLFELAFSRRIAELPPHMPMPFSARASAFVSLGTWLAVAACGRSIAYF
jgi:hypothetical protein